MIRDKRGYVTAWASIISVIFLVLLTFVFIPGNNMQKSIELSYQNFENKLENINAVERISKSFEENISTMREDYTFADIEQEFNIKEISSKITNESVDEDFIFLGDVRIPIYNKTVLVLNTNSSIIDHELPVMSEIVLKSPDGETIFYSNEQNLNETIELYDALEDKSIYGYGEYELYVNIYNLFTNVRIDYEDVKSRTMSITDSVNDEVRHLTITNQYNKNNTLLWE